MKFLKGLLITIIPCFIIWTSLIYFILQTAAYVAELPEEPGRIEDGRLEVRK